MKPIIIHPQAEEELEEATANYDCQRAGLGKEFRLEFEAALDRLKTQPLLYAIEVDDVRACPLRRFPFTIYYADLEDRIWLAAVAHQHRRPGYWEDRCPDDDPTL